MLLRLPVILIAVALTGTTSFAGPYEDCLRSPDQDLRLRACSEVVDGSLFSGSLKALAYRKRAGIRASAGLRNEALADYDAALKGSPDDALSYYGRALVRLAVEQIGEAINDLTVAIRLRPRNPRFFTARGYAYIVGNRFDAAIEDFNAALVLNPKDPIAHNNRGLAFRKKGKLKRAISDYTAAIQIQPAYALAYANRGSAYADMGRKAQAIADLEYALLIDPTLTRAINKLKRLKHKLAPGSIGQYAAAGQRLVEKNCSRCHAVGKRGESPNGRAPAFRFLQYRYPLRELRVPISRSIAAPHDVMPQFRLSEADIDRIVAYINSLTR